MKKFFKNKWVKRVIALVLVAVLAVGGVTVWNKLNPKTEETEAASTAIVTRRSITNAVTGSGTVQAYETYNIVPTVNGEIVMCDVEEGEWVEEDQVLYMFDTESSDNAISKSENSVENAALSLEQAQENVANLTIKAPSQGVVSNLSLILGDKTNGTVCTITDNTYMIAEIPVSSADVGKISTGDSVTVGLEKYMTTIEGTVDRKSTGSVAGNNGARVTYVDIVINNPGSISEGTMASATFHTASGDIDGAEAAQLNYPQSAKATAEQSGTVEEIMVKNGDWVDEGDIIAVLKNTQVENQLKTAQMNYSDAVSNLSDTRKKAEDYVLTSPIAGKVMEKNYKKGDTVAGQNSTTLMVIADTTRMKFTMNVDELDVAKIEIGQAVTIEADAIEGVVFEGRIETVSLLGTSSNGVTYYPVDVVIDSPGDLIPGMNISAEIIVESAENVIAVPASAVSYYDGSYYVTVVGEVDGMKDMGNMGERPRMDEGGMPFEIPTGEGFERPTGGMPEIGEGEMPQRGEIPQRGEGSMPMGGMSQRGEGSMPMGGMSQRGAGEAVKQTLYSEPQRVAVKTGVSDDDYIEITEGLEVGQIVSYTEDEGGNQWGGFGGFGGGMPMGGGMPAGRMR